MKRALCTGLGVAGSRSTPNPRTRFGVGGEPARASPLGELESNLLWFPDRIRGPMRPTGLEFILGAGGDSRPRISGGCAVAVLPVRMGGGKPEYGAEGL